MEARYWILRSDQLGGPLCWITPEGDVLPLTDFQTWNQIGSFTFYDQQYVIVHAVVPKETIQALAEEIGGDPLTLAATEYLGITRQYGGSTLAELKERLLTYWDFELPDTKEVDGEIVPFLIPSSMGPA